MSTSQSSRPSRKRKQPIKYRDGATPGELASHCITLQPNTPLDSGSPLPPPLSPRQPPKKKRGKKPKPQSTESEEESVIVILPEADSSRNAVVQGNVNNVEGVLAAAANTVESMHDEAYKSEDCDGKLVIKTKRKAKLKKLKAISKEEKQQQEQVDFEASLEDPKTVIFEPMREGLRRDPRPIYPEGTDLDSAYALFSLFWNDEMWDILTRNTNLYAQKEDGANQRRWQPTNIDELRVFVGILIYMGLHPEGKTADYWHEDLTTGPNHTPALHMGLVRFTQLQRFLHISPPGGPPEPSADEVDRMTAKEKRNNTDKYKWWRKMEPLLTTFRDNCKAYMQPGSNVSVDEMMIKFYSRSKHTTKMPNKPIQKGYKIWALCERGYLYNFILYSRVWKTVELDSLDELTDTTNVVYTLAKSLPPLPDGETYTIYQDNLFTGTESFRALRQRGIGAYGTTRPHNSPDFPSKLKLLKDKYYDKLPWGSLIAIPVDGVLCLGWIDNNVVLSLTTVHTVHDAADRVMRWRKRPLDTLTNAKQARKPFEGHGARMEQLIPRYIDDYNYNMGGVDITDQHRNAFKTQRKALRNWIPQWYWMIDSAVINAYKIGVFAPGKHWTNRQHRDFRERLWQELMKFSYQGEARKHTDRLPDERLYQSGQHDYVKISQLKHACAWCSHSIRLERGRTRTPSPTKRSFGQEIDPNIQMHRARRIAYGCSGCGVYLCGQKHDCWYRWHGQEPPAERLPVRGGSAAPSLACHHQVLSCTVLAPSCILGATSIDSSTSGEASSPSTLPHQQPPPQWQMSPYTSVDFPE